MRESRLYLTDIVSAITSIENFVQGMDKESFKADDKTASAVVRKLEIIGEAERPYGRAVYLSLSDARQGEFSAVKSVGLSLIPPDSHSLTPYFSQPFPRK